MNCLCGIESVADRLYCRYRVDPNVNYSNNRFWKLVRLLFILHFSFSFHSICNANSQTVDVMKTASLIAVLIDSIVTAFRSDQSLSCR